MKVADVEQAYGICAEAVLGLVRAGIIESERVLNERGRWRYELLDSDVEKVVEMYRKDRNWRVRDSQRANYSEQRQRTRELRARGMTARQIAGALGISLAAARKRVERMNKDSK